MIDEIITKALRTGGILTPSETLAVVRMLDHLLDAILLTPVETQDLILECFLKTKPAGPTSPESKPESSET